LVGQTLSLPGFLLVTSSGCCHKRPIIFGRLARRITRFWHRNN
jgi:hypothetical protein